MSEPSGDSPDQTPSAAPPADGPKPLTPGPRVNPPSVFHPKDAPPASAPPPGIAEFFQWMQQMGGAVAPSAIDPDAETARRVLPKEQKKFQRADPNAARPAVPAASAVPAVPEDPAPATRADAPAPLPKDRLLSGDLVAVPRARKGRALGDRGPWFVLGLQLGAFALAVGCFLLGRASVGRTAPAPLAAPAAPALGNGKAGAGGADAALAVVDRAMEAESKGDYRAGYELLKGVKASGTPVFGLDYHLALLAYESGDLTQVLPLLNRSIAAGEEVAACYNLRGTMSSRQGGAGKGLADLGTAARVDPFNPRYPFFLGEAERRAGQSQTALATLRQAVARQRDPNVTSLYQLKIRLTQIEAGQEGEFAAELAGWLAAARPPADWLLTAAAAALHRGDFGGAAGFLEKARERTDDYTFNLRLRDYFIAQYAGEKAVAGFFAPLIPAPVPAPAESPVPTP